MFLALPPRLFIKKSIRRLSLNNDVYESYDKNYL